VAGSERLSHDSEVLALLRDELKARGVTIRAVQEPVPHLLQISADAAAGRAGALPPPGPLMSRLGLRGSGNSNAA
jgi:hypothetical protein